MAEDSTPPASQKNGMPLWLERHWDWFWASNAWLKSSYVAILIFLLYLPLSYPLSYPARAVQGWFWDRGLFFDPKHEGVIIVESPQLFTRERLVNQRLSDSDWIEGRIKAVNDFVDENRFGLPDSIRTRALERHFGVEDLQPSTDRAERGGKAKPSKDQGGDGSSEEDPLKVNVNPKTEFLEAHEFRQYLVQKKYESVLDDAHDTHSNTLHRLNLNLFLSPGRKYSSSIAAVSIRLQQPTDPQWILHEYGTLLLDIREELSATADRLLEDRFSMLRPDNITPLPSEIDRLLRQEINKHAKRHRRDSSKLIQDAIQSYENDDRGRSVGELKRQVRALAPGTDIGILLDKYFFPVMKPNNNQQPSGPRIAAGILSELQGRCSDKVSLLTLLPPEFFASLAYGKMIADLKTKWTRVFPEDQPDDVKLEVALRDILYEAKLQIPCPRQEPSMTSAAMFEVLGRLAIKENLPDWADSCIPKPGQPMIEFQRESSKKFDFIENYKKCNRLKNKLTAIGGVHLVKAELAGRRIDYVGGVRGLEEFFYFDTDECDLNTCKIAVKTTAESVRDVILKANGNGFLTSAQAQYAQHIGNNKALQLFVELSCFSNARSYTVYPRKGAGRNVLNLDSEERSFFGVLGMSSASASDSQSRIEQKRHNSVFGIGDAGRKPHGQNLACERSLLTAINSMKKAKFPQNPVDKLRQMLRGNADELDLHWAATFKCLLAIEVNHTGGRPQGREECHKKGVKLPDKKMDSVPWHTFNIYHLTSVIRYLRQRDMTVSWVVHPADQGAQGHEIQSEPLSALISIPSWWSGVELVVETCWVRPKWLGGDKGEGLCRQSTEEKNESIVSGLFDGFIDRARKRGRTENSQVLPLPHNIDGVLPKLGFFLVRYPYLDRSVGVDISLETGRPKVQLRLTGKRLWKNPRVRIGEQWHSRVEVLPDMGGIVATFDCLAPLQQSRRKPVDERHLDKVFKRQTEAMLDWAKPLDGSELTDRLPLDEHYIELRQVQVWTSEGRTNPASIQVRAFRPVNEFDEDCWFEDKDKDEGKKSKDKKGKKGKGKKDKD